MDNNNAPPDDWGSANNNDWRSKTLHVTKENKIIYQICSWALAITIVSSVIGIIILGFYGKEIPSALVAISSLAVGALGNLFSRDK